MSLLLFAGIALLVGIDVAVDLAEGTSLEHVSVETSVLILASLGVVRVVSRNARLTREARNLQLDLATAKQQADRWRNEASHLLAGLGAAVGRQFDRWALTAAESEVALLLLKGLSLKQIADVRGVSERTVREQARAVYRKADLTGRAELSAFFLEDLLLPGTAHGPADQATLSTGATT